MADADRPAWLDYWARQPRDFPSFNPNWRPSQHDEGVGFYAPWEEVYAGFPEHARRLAVALSQTGIPLHLRSIRGGSQFQTTRDHDSARAYEAMRKALEPLLDASVKKYAAEVWMTISESTAFYRIAPPNHHWMSPAELRQVQRRRVLSTVFERDRITDSDRDCLNRMGQIWVANPTDRDMLVRCGVEEEKVRVIPIPYFPDDPHLALKAMPRRPGPLTFYHIGKWEPRKEQHNIIGAFLCAFEPGQARLFMKTSLRGPKLSGDYPQSASDSVNRWLEDERVQQNGWTMETTNKWVRLIHTRLSPKQMVQLHRTGDVYVTLSRGEGFDMPAYDAKLAAKRMIYTPSGGPQSFATAADLLVEKTGQVPCDPLYGWDERAHYLDYAFEDAVTNMRLAAADGLEALRAPMSQEQLQHFSAESVGAMMRDAIEELRGA